MAAVLTIRDLMTPTVVSVAASTSLTEVAREMRDENIAEVLVVEDGHVRGMVTDRDIVVHGVANGSDPDATTAGDVCRTDLVSVTSGAVTLITVPSPSPSTTAEAPFASIVMDRSTTTAPT